MVYKSKLLILVHSFLFTSIMVSPPANGDTQLSPGLELSGHLILYGGIRQTSGNREVGVNFGCYSTIYSTLI